MFTIDAKHFPKLREGHSNLGPKCPGCTADGRPDKHSFTSNYGAAQEWAKERGLREDVDVRIKP